MRRILPLLLCAAVLLCTAVPTALADDIRVPFLLYHSVPEELSEDDDILLNISEENFRAHMTAVKEEGYNAVTLDEYMSFVTSGTPLPENPVVITFDDGYENNYTVAYPILKELGIKATIFVIAGRVGDHSVKYPHFTWQEAAEMERSGLIDIQSHSLTHPDFSALSYAETVREMRLSKYLVEKNLLKSCDYMAYPYGHTSGFCAEVAKKAGYKLLCIVGNNGSNGRDADLSAIRRLNVSGDMDADYILEYIRENT